MPPRAPVLKSRKKTVDVADVDPGRAVRAIKLLGAVNLVFVVVTAGALWWGSRAADALRINAPAKVDDQPVTVAMEARMTSNGKPIRNGDTVTDATIVVHGILADFGRLREGLDGLAVTVRGTRVDIFPETGEFSERVILTPGKNRIEFGVWWDGREWQRQHAEVTYQKAAAPSSDSESL